MSEYINGSLQVVVFSSHSSVFGIYYFEKGLPFIKVIPIWQESAVNHDLTAIVASFVIFILLRELSHISSIIYSFTEYYSQNRKQINNTFQVHLAAKIISKHEGTALKHLFTLQFPVGF